MSSGSPGPTCCCGSSSSPLSPLLSLSPSLSPSLLVSLTLPRHPCLSLSPSPSLSLLLSLSLTHTHTHTHTLAPSQLQHHSFPPISHAGMHPWPCAPSGWHIPPYMHTGGSGVLGMACLGLVHTQIHAPPPPPQPQCTCPVPRIWESHKHTLAWMGPHPHTCSVTDTLPCACFLTSPCAGSTHMHTSFSTRGGGTLTHAMS